MCPRPGRATKSLWPISSCRRRDCRPISTILSSAPATIDRKSTRLNSSHTVISYAVFCLKKKKTNYKDAYFLLWNKPDQERVYIIYTVALLVFFLNDTATTQIYTLSLHDALPI